MTTSYNAHRIFNFQDGTGDSEPSNADELQESEYDTDFRKNLEEAAALQIELNKLNEMELHEAQSMEQKYKGLREPFTDKRNEVLSRIPNFWATAFKHHPLISTILSDEEEECLNFMYKVELEESEDGSGFRLCFYFAENPWFLNGVIMKEFYTDSEGPAMRHTLIQWIEDERSTLWKKAKENCPSFFNWLADDFDLSAINFAEIIRDDILQNPLQYYANIQNPSVDDNEDESYHNEEEESSGTDMDSDLEPEENEDDLASDPGNSADETTTASEEESGVEEESETLNFPRGSSPVEGDYENLSDGEVTETSQEEGIEDEHRNFGIPYEKGEIKAKVLKDTRYYEAERDTDPMKTPKKVKNKADVANLNSKSQTHSSDSKSIVQSEMLSNSNLNALYENNISCQ